MNRLFKIFTNGVYHENPLFRLVLGLCPALAVTATAENGFWMGVAVTFVLTCSNLVISLLRKLIPSQVRIPAFIVIIATFVTVVELVMQAFLPDMFVKLGIFIPLIVVNCIILARAESFASKNSTLHSVIDGLGMGIGYMVALIIVASIREWLGAGTIFGVTMMFAGYNPALIMVLAPGAFITLGLLLGLLNHVTRKSA